MPERKPINPNNLHTVLTRTNRLLAAKAWDTRRANPDRASTLRQASDYVRDVATYVDQLGRERKIDPRRIIIIFDTEAVTPTPNPEVTEATSAKQLDILPLEEAIMKIETSHELFSYLIRHSKRIMKDIATDLGLSKSWVDKASRGTREIPNSGFAHVICNVFDLAEDHPGRQRLVTLVVNEERQREEKNMQHA